MNENDECQCVSYRQYSPTYLVKEENGHSRPGGTFTDKNPTSVLELSWWWNGVDYSEA